MIESIEFSNYKALRKTTLPLAPFTLLLGPNGSGKSSVLNALKGIAAQASTNSSVSENGTMGSAAWKALRSVTVTDPKEFPEIKLRIRWENRAIFAIYQWHANSTRVVGQFKDLNLNSLVPAIVDPLLKWLGRMQVYSLDAAAIAKPVEVESGALESNGAGLAAVLDDLRDNQPEQWEALNEELCRWLPEFDRVLFEKPAKGHKAVMLRTKNGGHAIQATELSQGTLIALALLTLAYMPKPPSVVGLEEIDRGLHPRLLRNLQDALYRLSHPESCGSQRMPTQVIATTHSPYLLDLYRDHPEEVILAQKVGLEVTMNPLADVEHFEDILGDAPLSEIWYSGVLGGASVKR